MVSMNSIASGVAGGATVAILIQAIDEFSGTFTKAQKGTLMLGAALTGLGIAGAGAINDIATVGGKFQQTTIAFTALTGSIEGAKDMLQELDDYALSTPFSIPGIESEAKKLMAMGIPIQDVVEDMKAFNDVAAYVGMDSTGLERMTINLGQIQIKGKLMARDLRDFANEGIPMMDMLAASTGKAKSELMDMMSAGEISSKMVIDAFKQFGPAQGIAAKQTDTFVGTVQNLSDAMTQLKRVMSEALLPVLKPLVDAIQRGIKWFSEHPEVAKFAATLLLVGTAAALIGGPILIIIAMLPLITAGFAALSVSILPIAGIIVGIVIGITMLIMIFKKLVDNWEVVKYQMGAGILQFHILWVKVWGGIRNFFITIWNGMVSAAQGSVNMIIGIINRLIDAYNRVAGVLGMGKISRLQKINIDSMKADLIDVNGQVWELQKAYAEWRMELARAKVAQDAAADSTNQANDALSEQATIQDKLLAQQEMRKEAGKALFKYIPSTGDVFNAGAFSSSEFQSTAAYNQAKLGAGIEINIENVNGLDPNEVAEALNNVLRTKLSI